VFSHALCISLHLYGPSSAPSLVSKVVIPNWPSTQFFTLFVRSLRIYLGQPCQPFNAPRARYLRALEKACGIRKFAETFWQVAAGRPFGDAARQ
jgi:hypothetical protein